MYEDQVTTTVAFGSKLYEVSENKLQFDGFSIRSIGSDGFRRPVTSMRIRKGVIAAFKAAQLVDA